MDKSEEKRNLTKREKGDQAYTFAGKKRTSEEIDTQNNFINRLNLASFQPLKIMDRSDRGKCPKC